MNIYLILFLTKTIRYKWNKNWHISCKYSRSTVNQDNSIEEKLKGRIMIVHEANSTNK